MPRHATNVLKFDPQVVAKASTLDGKRTEWRIEGVPGLVLVCQPSGSATFYLFYRAREGKALLTRKLRLGERRPAEGAPRATDAIYLTLNEARAKAVDAEASVRKEGADPVADKRASRQATTFRELWELRKVKDDRLSPNTRSDYDASLRNHVLDVIGDKPLADVRRPDVRAVLDNVEKNAFDKRKSGIARRKRGPAKAQADKVKAAIGSTYRWGIRRGHYEGASPTDQLGNRAQPQPRTRVLSDDELKKLWTGIETEALTEPMTLILKLAILTGQRRNEIAGATVAELHGLDGEEPRWIVRGDSKVGGSIAKGRTKNRKQQIVPLSPAAVQLFKRAIELAEKSPYVFPADLKRVRLNATPKIPHIRGDSVSTAMSRVCLELGIADFTTHDARRCVSTWLGNALFRPEVIDLVLNHQPRTQDVTRTTYNHATMEPEVRRALNAWAGHVWRVTGQAEIISDKVIRPTQWQVPA